MKYRKSELGIEFAILLSFAYERESTTFLLLLRISNDLTIGLKSVSIMLQNYRSYFRHRAGKNLQRPELQSFFSKDHRRSDLSECRSLLPSGDDS
jgi:hypothetical protein